ncbi:MAG: hypothetical protein PHF86_00010 [Candidatus Nanoarchaeia archaeon]|nr:hypothetical protein [Candidatus Nanoarchaeia archaeon]
MKINANEIRISDSSYLNKDLWVCDLRFNNNSIEKPIRKVAPTKINLVSNDKVSKRIYYSDNSLVPYNKKGELVFSKAFGIYDNTGFRSFTGVPLEIFDSEEECKNQYKKLIKLAIQFINKKKEEFVNSADIQIKNLKSEL